MSTTAPPDAARPSSATPPDAAPPAATSTSPTARQLWTRTRGLLLAAVILLAAGVAIAAVHSDGQHGRLDPRAADPYGSRAVAELLADRGVSTQVVTTGAEARAAAGPGTTLLVAVPDLLTPRQQSRLHGAFATSGGRTVLVAPGPASVERLAPELTAEPTPSFDSPLAPHCSLPAARRAGPADTGGIRYTVSAAGTDSCYPSDDAPTLVRIPQAGGTGGTGESGEEPTGGVADGTAGHPAADGRTGSDRTGGDTVVIGAPDIFYNDRLDDEGNASLALQLLGSRPHLVWYLPSLSDDSAGDTGESSFFDLLPSGWLWGSLQLTVAAVLAALWRGRRLGPLVPERLPVVIRASETAEGRARLYRKASARDRAASALRAATRDRLAPLTGTAPAQAHAPETLLPALSARLRTPGGDGRLHALLFGPPPRDDTALVALADQLDALEREVRTS